MCDIKSQIFVVLCGSFRLPFVSSNASQLRKVQLFANEWSSRDSSSVKLNVSVSSFPALYDSSLPTCRDIIIIIIIIIIIDACT